MGSENKQYKGMAVVRASAIRGVQSTITDSRIEFLGHAHISYGIILPKDEPLEPEVEKCLQDRISELIKHCHYAPCSDPNSKFWWRPYF